SGAELRVRRQPVGCAARDEGATTGRPPALEVAARSGDHEQGSRRSRALRRLRLLHLRRRRRPAAGRLGAGGRPMWRQGVLGAARALGLALRGPVRHPRRTPEAPPARGRCREVEAGPEGQGHPPRPPRTRLAGASAQDSATKPGRRMLGSRVPPEQRAQERHGRLQGEAVAAPRPGLSGFVLGTCAAACWGFGPVATKAALGGYSPEVVGVVRLAGAALGFRALAGPGGGWWPDEPWLVLAGVALGLDFVLFTYGVHLTSAASAGLLVNFGQVANIVLAHLVLGEDLTARRLVGATLTFAGVMLVATATGGSDSNGSGSLTGNVLIMVAGVTWATYSVAQRPAARAPDAT